MIRLDAIMCIVNLLPIEGEGGWSANQVLGALRTHPVHADLVLEDLVETLMDGIRHGFVVYGEDGYALCSDEAYHELLHKGLPR